MTLLPKRPRPIPTLGLLLATGTFILSPSAANAQNQVRVEVTNNAPASGVYLTPFWVGFHNGSFDSYDGGSASAPELERLAEDGNTGPISDVFAANNTLVATGKTQTGTRSQATLGSGPIAPGETVSAILDYTTGLSNGYFSYASMVLPTNDYYVANGNPLAHNLSPLFSGNLGANVTFDIGLADTVNDAGTEVNDFAFSAGNGLFAGLAGGQSGPNQGTDQNGMNANVTGLPFAGFQNTPAGFDFGPLNFNDSVLYANGLATVSISIVPEPAAFALVSMAVVGALPMARRRRRTRERWTASHRGNEQRRGDGL